MPREAYVRITYSLFMSLTVCFLPIRIGRSINNILTFFIDQFYLVCPSYQICNEIHFTNFVTIFAKFEYLHVWWICCKDSCDWREGVKLARVLYRGYRKRRLRQGSWNLWFLSLKFTVFPLLDLFIFSPKFSWKRLLPTINGGKLVAILTSLQQLQVLLMLWKNIISVCSSIMNKLTS